MRIDIQKVSDLVAEVGRSVILPRWRNLQAHEISEKTGPHDLVTIADHEAEEMLAPLLRDLLPGSLVLGEERYATDPVVLTNLLSEQPVWIIDPVDGTKNFSEGAEQFGTIVALVHKAETLAGWIHHPVTGDTLVTERGGGAFFKEKKLSVVPPASLTQLHGTLGVRLHKPVALLPGDGPGPVFDKNRNVSCEVYVALLTGDRLFPTSPNTYRQAAFRVTLMGSKPWDDAAGVLAVREGGGEVIDWAGERYRPDMFDNGIIAGPGLETCLELRAWLMPAYRDTIESMVDERSKVRLGK